LMVSPPYESPPSLERPHPPPRTFSAARALYSSEFCLGLFNIACFFTEVPHNILQTKAYIL
jgi:hypothetical protein